MTLAPFSSRQRRGGGQLAGVPAYRWDPRREIDEINNRFGQLIQTFFGDTPGLTGAAGWSPVVAPVDIEETDDAYVVDVDLPNVSPEDVTLEMRGEELRISGSFQQREQTGVVRRQNRQVGDFEYVVDLPSDIDPNRVEATYDNGVLTVRVGKTQDAQPRRIEIRGAQGRQDGQGAMKRDGQGAMKREGQHATAGDGQGDGQQAAQRDRQRS